MTTKSIFKIITIVGVFYSTTGNAQINPANNLLGTLIDSVNYESYSHSFTYTDSICASSVMISAPWSELEPSPGNFDFSSLQRKLNLVKARGNLKMEVNIQPLHMGSKTVPSDLVNLTYDNPLMIQRYKAILDSVFNRIDTLDILAFNIGNEYEFYLFDTIDPIARIAQWMDFFKQAKTYAKQKYLINHPAENLRVGTTFTYDGLTGASNPWMRSALKYINDSCYTDIISVNYYAIDTGFMNFKDPIKVFADFDTMVNVYQFQTKPFFITECGYPSGDSCGSSNLKQSQFITNVFAAWDIHQSRIEYISLFKLQDWSWWVANYFTQAFSGVFGWTTAQQIRFREYLRTLGLRDGNGIPKPDYYTLKNELSSRSYCQTATGIKDVKGNENSLISIFPNPTNDKLNIATMFDLKNAEMKIYNQFGQIVKIISNINNRNIHVETTGLSNGVYYIVFLNGESQESRKFIINK